MASGKVPGWRVLWLRPRWRQTRFLIGGHCGCGPDAAGKGFFMARTAAAAQMAPVQVPDRRVLWPWPRRCPERFLSGARCGCGPDGARKQVCQWLVLRLRPFSYCIYRICLHRNCGLGMDALETVCSWNTNGIMAWAWIQNAWQHQHF